MKERPILFSAPMARAILAGTKTQTRRVITNHPGDQWTHDGFGRITSKHPKQGRFGLFVRRGLGTDFPECDIVPCPYGQPGDQLWVRETWGLHAYGDDTDWVKGSCTDLDLEDSEIAYRADWGPMQESCHWRPSIHMPRAASRISLEITSVRVERLGDVSESDARAEGVVQSVAEFKELWASINGPSSWDANPWVWVVEVKRVEGGAA